MIANISAGPKHDTYTLRGRNALAFKNWWNNGPAIDSEGFVVKVSFNDGDFQVKPGSYKGGYEIPELKVRFSGNKC